MNQQPDFSIHFILLSPKQYLILVKNAKESNNQDGIPDKIEK